MPVVGTEGAEALGVEEAAGAEAREAAVEGVQAREAEEVARAEAEGAKASQPAMRCP